MQKQHLNHKNSYKAFGFTISSDFKLPELQSIQLNNDSADIAVIQTNLSFKWEALVGEDNDIAVKPNFIMFRIPDVAIYLINNGNEIFVSPFTGAEEDQVRLYMLGTCMGAILLQRKILPLHGSAIAIEGRAYAVVGHSGAGKSTLASAFLNRGYQLLSDDVIPVTLSHEGIPIVTPAYPQQKLWLNSLEEFGMPSEHLRPIINRESKFAVPVADRFMNKQMPLAGIIELTKTEDAEIQMSPIQDLERLHRLYQHTYRNMFIGPLGLLEWHFNITAKIINSIKMFELQRPASRFTANKLVDLILPKIAEKERVR